MLAQFVGVGIFARRVADLPATWRQACCHQSRGFACEIELALSEPDLALSELDLGEPPIRPRLQPRILNGVAASLPCGYISIPRLER